MNVIPEIDLQLCDGCGTCMLECHAGAVEMMAGKAVITRPEECDYCTDCEALCPQQAISCPLEIVLWDRSKEW